VLFSRNLNENKLYIALFLEKSCKNLGALEVPPLNPSLILTRIVKWSKTFKACNSKLVRLFDLRLNNVLSLLFRSVAYQGEQVPRGESLGGASTLYSAM